MEMDCEEVERLILATVAAKFVDTLPENEKRKILEASLTSTLKDILRPWNVKEAIEEDVNKYMNEYIQKPEIQERIKKSTEQNVDKLMDGIIEAIITSSQDAIKSKYKEFLPKKC